jgi:peptidoglycan/xylan/chitin deacetylase (PgdA/CDA1 family)
MKKIKSIEFVIIVAVFVLFVLLVNKYIINNFDVPKLAENGRDFIEELRKDESVQCKDGQIKISLADGELCRDDVQYQGNEDDIYLEIFDTYPKYGNGKEFIYDFLNQGELEVADNYLEGNIDIERYEPVKMEKINWEEDPYGEKYWKFLFYSLRETRHLLYAYEETGDVRYLDKLKEIVESFTAEGIEKSATWDDYHAVSFRAMVLTNTWWRLREANALDIDLNEKILKAISRHGDFLLDESHYERKYNHGLNEATALLLLGENFSTLEGAEIWLETGAKRVNEGLDVLIDEDGVLIENSPYYHFYVLEKYWGLKQYFTKNDITVDETFSRKLDKMVDYGTYILQPNLGVPLLGASLERQVGNQGVYNEIAKQYPSFAYVITQGREGEEPEKVNKYYQNTGQVVMRSGWEKKTNYENEYEMQTQLIFDAGPYRTDHSDFDALSFNLYGNGKLLLTDTGLYTYEEDDELKKYFHGTRGHNTVVVDGQDQRSGEPEPGDYQEGDGYVYYSAQHNLYPQTFHQRGVMLVGEDLVIVIDRMMSNKEHDYEQIFHLAPGLQAEESEGEIIVRNDKLEKETSIKQIEVNGLQIKLGDLEKESNDNLCSKEYEKSVPCQTLSFKKHAQNTTFVTLIEIGGTESEALSYDDNQLIIKQDGHIYTISLNDADNGYFEKLKIRKEEIASYSLDLVRTDGTWLIEGGDSENFSVLPDKNNKLMIVSEKNDFGDPAAISYLAQVEGVDSFYSKKQVISTSIPWDAKVGTFKIYEQEDYLPILGYHHVIDDDKEINKPSLEIHKADFERQIDYLTNEMNCRWYAFVEIMEDYVLKGEKIPDGACVMNFDDGRMDNYDNAYSVMKKYQGSVVASFYIIADRAMNGSEDYMHFPELDELYLSGNEIGSHTVTHPGLVNDGLSQIDIGYQLSESKKILEKQGYDVKTFAYPKGEQDEKIVSMVSQNYIAARDIEKDNSWRERRPLTISQNENQIWNMNYYKPEQVTIDQLEAAMGYNGFWQFEEGYRVDSDIDKDIRPLSSYKPTDLSYAILELPDAGDRISSKFMVGQDGKYTIETYVSVSEEGSSKYVDGVAINIGVDGKYGKMKVAVDEDCKFYENQYYCYYSTVADLSAGAHELNIKANIKEVKLDKYRIYRETELKDSYKIDLAVNRSFIPAQYPEKLKIELNKSYASKRYFYFGGSALLVIFGAWLLKKYLQKK